MAFKIQDILKLAFSCKPVDLVNDTQYSQWLKAAKAVVLHIQECEEGTVVLAHILVDEVKKAFAGHDEVKKGMAAVAPAEVQNSEPDPAAPASSNPAAS